MATNLTGAPDHALHLHSALSTGLLYGSGGKGSRNTGSRSRQVGHRQQFSSLVPQPVPPVMEELTDRLQHSADHKMELEEVSKQRQTAVNAKNKVPQQSKNLREKMPKKCRDNAEEKRKTKNRQECRK